MAMPVLYETDSYAYAYDARLQVGRFIRKSDGAISLLNMGRTAVAERAELDKLWRLLDTDTELRVNTFNEMAGECDFYSRNDGYRVPHKLRDK